MGGVKKMSCCLLLLSLTSILPSLSDHHLELPLLSSADHQSSYGPELVLLVVKSASQTKPSDFRSDFE